MIKRYDMSAYCERCGSCVELTIDEFTNKHFEEGEYILYKDLVTQLELIKDKKILSDEIFNFIKEVLI